MSRAEILHKFDEIVDFAEVEKFLDTPVKFYSSGMYVRLAFAVAAHLEPDILIVDEVLAVGDAAFQKKCLGKMESVTHQGRTVVFVSHNMAAINSMCNRGILLSNGQIEKDGTAKTVSQYYLSQSTGPKSKALNHEVDSSLKIQFLKTELIETISAEGVEVVIFRSKYLVRDQVSSTLLLCVETRNSNDVSVFYSNDDQLLNNQKRQIGQHVVELVIPKYLLAPGDYYVAFGFWEPGHPPEHFPETKLSFTRAEPENNRLNKHGIAWPSIIYLPTTWKYISGNNVSKSERNE
jgi:lipopolysaccharide transport system ATP-binding protein